MSPSLKTDPPPKLLADAGFTQPLDLVVLYGEDGPELARRSLVDADLADMRAERWLETYLRRGRVRVTLDQVQVRVTPQFAKGRCQKFSIETVTSDGWRDRCEVGLELWSDDATLMVQELTATGRLKADDTYRWLIEVARKGPAVEAPPPFTIKTRAAPLVVSKQPLAPLLNSAQPVGEIDPTAVPILFVRRAFERAEQFSRRGAEFDTPVETGALLIGSLGSCPETGEMYAVVTDALELFEAEERRFSLTFTGQTWTRLQAILKARQSQPGGESVRVIGQAHGHNFIPGDGAPPCEHCHLLAICTRSSVFASSDDRQWMRAVMAGQPIRLCGIFGLNARREQVHGMYALKNNHLAERSYYLIDEFHP